MVDLGTVEEHSDGAVEGGVEDEGTRVVCAMTAVLGCRPFRKHLTLCLWPKNLLCKTNFISKNNKAIFSGIYSAFVID